MEFITDKQTLDDLNILGRYKKNSIFSLFHRTVTIEGSWLLEKMFNNPLTDVTSINTRSDIFSFFERINISLPFNSDEFEVVENYIRTPESSIRMVATFNITKSWLLNYIVGEKEYPELRTGLEKTIEVFARLKELIKQVEKESRGTHYHEKAKRILALLDNKYFDAAWQCAGESPLPYKKVLQLDYLFRSLLNDPIEDLLKDIYELDVYISVSAVSRELGFVYATSLEKEEEVIELKQVYHPWIPGAVGNDIHIDKDKNVLFLTGANMAGKSTLMKSFAIAVYLAHMGFPVAAKKMSFSIHEGIFTSINVPDNLAMGYSHFYAEVLRVKYVAEKVATNKQLVIIFDELFKGTNVKDAYDGMVAIVDAFSKRNGSFIISTHIMEAGETLSNNPQLFFKYLPTVMKGTVPAYTYKLEDGITDDRHGMIIIKNEKILDILNEAN